MQITWFFGNGLDIGFGLKTRYKDFYEYLLKNEDKKQLESNSIFQQLKKDFENHQEDLWSDYEMRLGQLTENLSENQLEQWRMDKVYMDVLLEEYLAEENKKINIENDHAKEILVKSLSELEKCQRLVDNNKLKTLFQKYAGSNFMFKAISFNYTDTVSLLWENDKDSIHNIKLFGYPDRYYCQLMPPFYVHGKLGDGEMIVGVNDETQINCSKLQNNTILKELLVKTKLIEAAGQLHLTQFRDIVNSSQLLCIYGLSIGATDSCYWEIIKKRLLESDVLLIIYSYVSDYRNLHIALSELQRKKIKQTFYKNSNATAEEISKIDDKIIVEINHTLFIE